MESMEVKSRSLKLHVKYFKNVDKYDDGVNRSRRRAWQTLVLIMGLETACIDRYVP